MISHYPLTSLYLYLTDACNLSCSHCWISPRLSKQLQSGIPFDPLTAIIHEAKLLGLQSVKLTGGEPLLYREIKELLVFLSSENLAIYIETNGTLLDSEMITLLEQAAVTQISVSLDSAKEKIHDAIRGVRGGFQQTLKGLRLLSETGLNFQIIMTLQRKNSREIPTVIDLCRSLKVGSLKINHLLPCGRGAEAYRRGENLTLEELRALYRQVMEISKKNQDLEVDFDIPLAFRSIQDITHRGICECEILNILGILADGEYSICGIGKTVPELRMGNILNDSIRDTWRHHPVLSDLRRSLPEKLRGICKNCIFKFQCLGGCRASAYAMEKDLYAPYFLCQALYDANQFPSSRYIG